MEKFVPYNIASALKDMGFDEPCFARYRRKLFQFNTLGKPIKHNSEQLVEGDVSAPMWQDVFDWFREQHGYDLYIVPMSFAGVTCYYDIELRHRDFVWDNPPKVTSQNYHEVIELCAEKLIELALNGNEI